MSAANTLPAAFAALEPFVDAWALPTSDERLHKRMNTSMEDIRVFYDAALPLTEQALAHLDRHSLDALPPAETRLFQLLLAAAEAALAVEVYRAPRLPLAPSDSRFRVRHSHMGAP
ncbi:MAG: hypothetical protein AB7I01_17540 [Gammaproteobacteria bacterium]